MRSHTDIRNARQIVADEIDRLIAYLDAIDTDPDLEETGDDEPSLGFYVGSPDLELDTSDDEPSLGSFDRMIDQEKSYRQHAGWHDRDAELDRSDFEDGGDTEPECEDEGGQCDDEGWTESGIGDPDGLIEQTGCINGSGGATACL